MHRCSKEEMQQLFCMLTDGKAPEKYLIQSHLWWTDQGVIDYEAFVDAWPHFSAVVLRPNPKWQPGYVMNSFYTYASDYNKLREMLSDRDLVPWKQERIIFKSCNSETGPIVQEIASQNNVQMSLQLECKIFTFDKLQSTRHRSHVPAGFTLDSIKEEEAYLVNRHWPLSEGAGTELEIQHMAKHLPSVCIRNEKGEMVSWTMLVVNGQMGKAHTFKEYRRRGFNKILIAELLYQCRGLGFPLWGAVVKGNDVLRANADSYPATSHHPGTFTNWIASAGNKL